jgi:phosphoribosylaminoimidazole-succinocarboxamide synthase
MVQRRTILASQAHVLKTLNIPGLGKKYQGKVRDFYTHNNQRILITTDRQSAFDVILGCIPFKGSVLNLLSAFWFEHTKQIIPNHMISIPDPNVLIGRECVPIPVEMIVRGYMSGVTKTSIWYSYQQGERDIYGIRFPDGLTKNDQLPQPVITPTTHGGGANGHDERLTKKEIIERKIVSQDVYKQMEQAALKLFQFGSELCKKQGLILVDTKYEFGLYDGRVMLMDEIHTPDSSRFWIADTYRERIQKSVEPENFDKEFLRLWYAERGYRGDGDPPNMPDELVVSLAQRYIGVYEKITGETFHAYRYPIDTRIIKTLTNIYAA